MKKIFLLSCLASALMMLQSCVVSHRPKMAYFDSTAPDAKDAKFTSINVPMFLAKPLIKKALRDEGESEELINLVKKLKDVKIMTVENGSEKMIANHARALLNNNYEDWLTIRKDNEIVNFRAQQKGDVIRRLLITVTSAKNLVFVDVTGKFTADDISKIINYSEKSDVKKIVSK